MYTPHKPKMTTIIYTPALEGIERQEIIVDITEYKRICERRKTIFEKLPDDIPIKPFLDFDFKKKHAVDDSEIYDCTEQLIALGKKHICKQLTALGATTPPQFASKSATQIENGIISFHLICTNYKMTKKEQSIFFQNVEMSIEADTEDAWRRDYLEVKPDTRFIDFTVYSRNRFLRSSYSTKSGENRHFEIVEGTFEDTVISFDNCNATVVSVPIPVKTVNTLPCTVSGIEAEEISAYLDAGLFKKLANDYKSWTEMGFAINGACGQKGLPLFLQFSALCPEKYDEYYCTEWYERLDSRTDGRGMGSIKYLAKQENTKEYERISKLFAIKKSEKEQAEAKLVSTDRIVETDTEAALLILQDLSGRIIYADGRTFIKKMHIWTSNDEESKHFILDTILKSNIKKAGKKDPVPYAQNVKPAECIYKAICTIIKNTFANDNIFYQKLHSTTKGRICFLDGVLDFVSKKFYLWNDKDLEIYSTQIINYEFASYFANQDLELQNHIIDTLLKPLFGDKTNRALHFLSRGIAGNCEDKNWATYLGNRDCGKGVLYDLLFSAFGQYVKTFELSNILYERKRQDNNEISRKLYWLLDFEFIRLAISQETPDKDSTQIANGKMIKKLAGGGDTHVARRNYDRVDTYFNIDATFMIMGNDPLRVDTQDCFEHCVQFASCVKFQTAEEIEYVKQTALDPREWADLRIKDLSLKSKVQLMEWKYAIIMILYNNYHKFPVNIETIAEDEDEVPLRRLIFETFELTGNLEDDFLPVEIVVSKLRQTKKKVITEMTGLGIEKRKCNKKPYKDHQCFFGIKLREIIKDPEEENAVENDADGWAECK